MPALVAGIHAFLVAKTWMGGTSPAMTKKSDQVRGRLFRDHALLSEHDLFRKPVPTFRDHALALVGLGNDKRPIDLVFRLRRVGGRDSHFRDGWLQHVFVGGGGTAPAGKRLGERLIAGADVFRR